MGSVGRVAGLILSKDARKGKHEGDKKTRFKKESIQNDGGSTAGDKIRAGEPARSEKAEEKSGREKSFYSGESSSSSMCSSTSSKPGFVFSDFDNLGASTLGLNRIKTRSGPLTETRKNEKVVDDKSFFSQEQSRQQASEAAAPAAATTTSAAKGSKKQKSASNSGLLASVRDSPKQLGHKAASKSGVLEAGFQRRSTEDASSGSWIDSASPGLEASTSGSHATDSKISWNASVNSDSSRNGSENLSPSDSVKETDSPRFQALLRVTSTKKNKLTNDIKSFSHELDPKGVRNVFWRPHIFGSAEDVIGALRSKFSVVKEEINTELEVFAADLVEILEKNDSISADWKSKIEDLLVFAQHCAMMSAVEFRQHCESIVQDLDDRRQDLPMGLLKQLHTRMLFILTRCTRLLQLTGLDEEVSNKLAAAAPSSKSSIETPWTTGKKEKAALKPFKEQKIFFSQELNASRWKERGSLAPHLDAASPQARQPFLSALPRPSGEPGGALGIVTERLASWKKFGQSPDKATAVAAAAQEARPPAMKQKESGQLKKSPSIGSTEELKLVCRICEETVPASQVGDHSRVCAVADRCFKGISIDEKLIKLAETLEKMADSYTPKSTGVGLSPALNLRRAEGGSSGSASPKLGDMNSSRRGSGDILDELHEMDAATLDDLRGFGSVNGKSRFGPKSDQGLSASSTGSRTPCSPMTTPRTSQIDLLLTERASAIESDDVVQINELADIARCAASTDVTKDGAHDYLGTCLQDLQDLLQLCKVEGLTVHTFGKRIEKLLKEKYHLVSDVPEHESTTEDDDDDGVASLQSTPHHPSTKDRTSIDDFKIIKPISRGAFGRVFLAQKRTTGDLFAIKVLRKSDMIRKNAVESVHAERNILISAKNPFVVRFFYSFTCKDNLYLVMEYLNGGDMYSMLRNLGCLDEDMARQYIAELVLALEYLHSLAVVHRDLKPDNLLIAHDGHIKLTDFGLSKVGLINSTDDLSGPVSRGTVVENFDSSDYSKKRELRQQKSAVGTPDYLAPEILLGTAHGYPADWWSVGVILFEFLTGVPPFNAEHPQNIFDNILNRNIPWPRIPEDMSHEAADLIEQLLAEDPNHRLGAKGAAQVKAHPFFRGVQWDTIGSQQAVFIPSPEGAHDTSYFTSRHNWGSADAQVYGEQDFPESSDYESSCDGSGSSLSSRHEEGRDECNDLAEFDSPPSNQYSFSNFSFKNLSQLVSINYDLVKEIPRP